MVVKSKFNIGDYVWYVSNNAVQKGDVTGIGILLDGDKKPDIKYTIHFDKDVDECKVFKTKEELLNSL